jgi:hypothetical protein
MICGMCGTCNPDDATSCLRCGSLALSSLPSTPLALPGVAAAPARPLHGLAVTLTILLSLDAALSLAELANPSILPRRHTLTRTPISAEIALGMLALVVAQIVLFLAWFYRARINAGQSTWPQRHAPGWAVGSWFVPVIFLWYPYQIMADIWRAGRPPDRRQGPASAVLPGLWWAFWLLAWFTGFRHATTQFGAMHVSNYQIAFGGTVPSAAFAAVAAIALVAIIQKVTAAQRPDTHRSWLRIYLPLWSSCQ